MAAPFGLGPVGLIKPRSNVLPLSAEQASLASRHAPFDHVASMSPQGAWL